MKKYRVHPTHWLISTQVDDGGGAILSGATALRTGAVNAGGEKISVGGGVVDFSTLEGLRLVQR